jgi:diadenosine tetraphosphate (Ap4A) HIT family hydrolase
LGWWCTRASRALREVAGAERVYAAVIGDQVPHLHVHLTARYPVTPSGVLGEKVAQWPDAPRGLEPQIADLVRDLRAYLNSTWIAVRLADEAGGPVRRQRNRKSQSAIRSYAGTMAERANVYPLRREPKPELRSQPPADAAPPARAAARPSGQQFRLRAVRRRRRSPDPRRWSRPTPG